MADTQHTIAIVGQGVMGAGIARHLNQRGFRVITSLSGRSADSVRRAQAAGMVDVGSIEQLAAEADIILSVLPPSQALSFAEKMAPLMKGRGADVLFADLNAKAPSKAEKIRTLITGSGVAYVDGAITGPPPSRQRPTNFFVAGPELARMRVFKSDQIQLVECGADPVAASKLKMCVSASTKARMTTYLMALIAAKRMGIYNSFKMAQQGSDPAAWKIISGTGPRMAAAAGRWSEEFDEVAQMMEDESLPPTLYEGVAEMFRILEDSPLGAETKETLDPNRDIDAFIEIIAGWDGTPRG